MNYLLLGVLIFLIFFYTTKEGITTTPPSTETKIAEFLNTWSLTNDELSKTMTISDDKIVFNKNTEMTNLKASTVSANDITSTGKLYVSNLSSNSNTIQGDVYKNMKVNQGMLHVTGWTGGNTGSVIAQQQLCIGNENDKTCLTREHLKLLTGERDVFLKNVGKNSFIDCGGRISNASGTTAKMTQGNSCYANDLTKTNNNQQFRLEF